MILLLSVWLEPWFYVWSSEGGHSSVSNFKSLVEYFYELEQNGQF